jgi:hypothetical protein
MTILSFSPLFEKYQVAGDAVHAFVISEGGE